MIRFESLPPLGLYVHLPWCVRKCPYCDFNSHAAPEAVPEREYVDALLRDLESELPGVWGRTTASVYLGGGTPSLFSPESIAHLLSGIRSRLRLSADPEITLEANPGTVDQARFEGFRQAGVTRLSIGVQSFDPRHLQDLGRIHSRAHAQEAAGAARRAGFDNFNLDLMFGLPGQTPAEALADLQAAIDHEPTHLSLYQLTIEPNTLFHRQPPMLPDEDTVALMQAGLFDRLTRAGYSHYEVSAHARPGNECRHNLNYWQFGDYLGIGAGAHGKISRPDGIRRRWKQRHPRRYLETVGGGTAVGDERELAPRDVLFEFLLNALRLTDGFSVEVFERHTGLTQSTLDATLQPAMDRGLLERTEGTVRPSALGRRFLDDLVEMFLPEA